jgi:gamma-butyrobetaine dioxygenase
MLTTSPPRQVSVAADGGGLTVVWADGRASPFPALWLADNRPERRRGPLGQRLADAVDLPDAVAIRAAEVTPAGIAVEFAGAEPGALFDPGWLRAHALDPASRAERRHRPQLWDAALAHVLPVERYEDVAGDETALARWLRRVRDLGFAMLRGVPTRPGMVVEVIRRFGYVRETNYGRLFDVVSTEAAHNLANTALGLGNHTDNPYRDPVPQLQLLHCLEAAATGGESVAVDGFAAAERLRREAPEAFALLSRTPVTFRYVEPGAVDLEHRAPLIELDLDGEPRTIRYNNRSMAPLDLDPEAIPPFYAAYRRFGRLLHDPALALRFRLGPGDLFIVDNRRVLHGRGSYGGGRRHLQGAYADADALLSRLRVAEGRP